MQTIKIETSERQALYELLKGWLNAYMSHLYSNLRSEQAIFIGYMNVINNGQAQDEFLHDNTKTQDNSSLATNLKQSDKDISTDVNQSDKMKSNLGKEEIFNLAHGNEYEQYLQAVKVLNGEIKPE